MNSITSLTWGYSLLRYGCVCSLAPLLERELRITFVNDHDVFHSWSCLLRAGFALLTDMTITVGNSQGLDIIRSLCYFRQDRRRWFSSPNNTMGSAPEQRHYLLGAFPKSSWWLGSCEKSAPQHAPKNPNQEETVTTFVVVLISTDYYNNIQ